MILFLLVVVVLEVALLLYFYYVSIFEPFLKKKRFFVYEDVKKELEHEQLYNSFKK